VDIYIKKEKINRHIPGNISRIQAINRNVQLSNEQI